MSTRYTNQKRHFENGKCCKFGTSGGKLGLCGILRGSLWQNFRLQTTFPNGGEKRGPFLPL